MLSTADAGHNCTVQHHSLHRAVIWQGRVTVAHKAHNLEVLVQIQPLQLEPITLTLSIRPSRIVSFCLFLRSP